MGLLFGPPVASFAVRWFTSSDPWFPIFALWVVAVILAFVGGWAYEEAAKIQKRFFPGAVVTVGQAEPMHVWNGIAIGMIVLAEATVSASFEPWIGFAVVGLALAWLGFCAITPQRFIRAGFVLDVSRPPAEVFAFLSDLKNLTLYEPTATILPPLPASSGVGAVRHVRAARENGIILEADDMITEFVPPRRLSVELLGVKQIHASSYDLEPIPGGTRISYTFNSTRPISELAGGRFVKRSELKRLARIHRARSERLRHVLDGI